MASFEAKIGWKRIRERENKSYRSVLLRSNPMRNWKFQKKSKKIEKNKIYHCGFIWSQNRLEKDEGERK